MSPNIFPPLSGKYSPSNTTKFGIHPTAHCQLDCKWLLSVGPFIQSSISMVGIPAYVITANCSTRPRAARNVDDVFVAATHSQTSTHRGHRLHFAYRFALIPVCHPPLYCQAFSLSRTVTNHIAPPCCSRQKARATTIEETEGIDEFLLPRDARVVIQV
ncbi:hypothetical protein IF1G_03681 [Cordyceps javanica]|uniref:Uncharacterized protein n=1 Tax=Cordyceps javanica TaxID=43265 RepID=A0A545V890_9HYPO|nr:hypothetical protein IF1G_03681 [Cordyceps javanica]